MEKTKDATRVEIPVICEYDNQNFTINVLWFAVEWASDLK